MRVEATCVKRKLLCESKLESTLQRRCHDGAVSKINDGVRVQSSFDSAQVIKERSDQQSQARKEKEAANGEPSSVWSSIRTINRGKILDRRRYDPIQQVPHV